LDPVSQPKFINPLPIAGRIDMTGGGYLEIEARQIQQQLGIYDPVTGVPLMTTVWGYNGSYPGPTLVARRDVPIDVRWTNGLVDAHGTPLPHLLPVDTSIHWAMPENWPACGVPLTTHVHGAHVESESDGLPDSWYTPGFTQTGPGWFKEVLHYDNTQEAATIWYHDHVLGMTRLNVYAGLAGFYLIRDENEDELVAGNFLPTGPYEIEMAFQDKMFTTEGALFYPAEPPDADDPAPSHLPEMFGNVMLVNAKAWPVLEVEPRQYRFRIVNGCDSRFLQCFLTDPANSSGPVPAIWKIGNDSGLLNLPVSMPRWLQGPGERVDMVFDFSNPAFWGRTFVLRNTAKTPYPSGDPVDPRTTGQIMAFRVVKPLDTSVYPVTALPKKPNNLRPMYGAITMPVANAPARKLILFEGTDEFGRIQPKLGTLDGGAMGWNDPITENPQLNSTEVWEIYNTTMDSHPIHLHLVSFLVLNRQAYRGDVDPATGKITNLRLGNIRSIPSDEKGWKDTVIMNPGEVTRIIATFDREGLYVWHCHIVSHEDNEMMRPYYVGAVLPPWPYAAMAAVTPASSSRASSSLALESVYPNPFNPSVTVRFAVKAAGRVDATIYDVTGRAVRQLAHRAFTAGSHELRWNGETDTSGVASTGVYFLRIQSGGVATTRRLVLLK
jgi:spore coat protein A